MQDSCASRNLIRCEFVEHGDTFVDSVENLHGVVLHAA